MRVTSSMSSVGKLDVGSVCEPPLLLTVEEAAEMLRIGRTLAYALARRYEDTDGLEGRLATCGRLVEQRVASRQLATSSTSWQSDEDDVRTRFRMILVWRFPWAGHGPRSAKPQSTETRNGCRSGGLTGLAGRGSTTITARQESSTRLMTSSSTESSCLWVKTAPIW